MGEVNLNKASLYSTQLDATYGKVGLEEQEGRNAFNAVVNILNASWSTWSPTVTYTATGPSNVGATGSTTEVAYYKQIGATVFFKYQCVAGAQSGINCSDATITLPVTPADDNTYPIVQALMLSSGATYVDPHGYIDMTTGSATKRFIRFRDFYKLIATNPYALYINGFYSVV